MLTVIVPIKDPPPPGVRVPKYFVEDFTKYINVILTCHLCSVHTEGTMFLE